LFKIVIVLFLSLVLFSCAEKVPTAKRIKKSYENLLVFSDCFKLDNNENILRAQRLKKFGEYKFSFVYDFSSQDSEATKIKSFCYERIKHDKIFLVKTMKAKVFQ